MTGSERPKRRIGGRCQCNDLLLSCSAPRTARLTAAPFEPSFVAFLQALLR
ncbi:hypothetical protein LguiB_018993 [Lonicera macranthoides]